MRINGDNYSNFGEMVVKYGIPEPPKPCNKKKTSHSDQHFIIKPFVRVTPEMLQADEDDIVIKYGIPTPPQNDDYKPQKDRNEDVALKYAIPSQPTQVSGENTSFLKKFLDKLFKK